MGTRDQNWSGASAELRIQPPGLCLPLNVWNGPPRPMGFGP